MRLTPEQIEAIKQTASAAFGGGTAVWLFGSRVDDAKKGGRYVIMPTAAPINVPLSPITERNYGIFIEAALKYGNY